MQELFDSTFKFKINESVRHKADNHKFESDMGLLVLERHLIESLDAEGKVVYERNYVCRLIRWSGSGDLGRFNERELISVKEHDTEKIKRDQERNFMLDQARLAEKEVMEFFGINKQDYLHELINGKPDTSKKFRMSGFASDEKGLRIFVRESLFTAANRGEEGKKVESESREWSSKTQFQKAESAQ